MKPLKKITSYLHQVEQHTDQPNPAPGPYYVSCRDGSVFGLLLGPFDTHKEALDMVVPVRAKAIKLNVRAHFYGFGTCRIKSPSFNRPGTLNKYFEKENSIEDNGKTSSPHRH